MDMYMVMIGVLMLLLLIAAWQDIRHYRIRNWLVISGALSGVLMHAVLPTGLDGYDALLGWGVGLLLLLPLYLLRAMGAGDVKLMAMVGAFLGPQGAVMALLYILVTGGVLSIAVACWRGRLGRLFSSVQIMLYEFMANVMTSKTRRTVPLASAFDAGDAGGRLNDASTRMPYGVAIAVGTAVFVVVNQVA